MGFKGSPAHKLGTKIVKVATAAAAGAGYGGAVGKGIGEMSVPEKVVTTGYKVLEDGQVIPRLHDLNEHLSHAVGQGASTAGSILLGLGAAATAAAVIGHNEKNHPKEEGHEALGRQWKGR